MQIAEHCLQTMNNNLKFNICDLDRSEQHMKRDALPARVRNSIPPHLAYACTYWASHLVAGLDNGTGLSSEVQGLLEQFASRHLLHWLEVLSIIGRVDGAYRSVEMIYASMVRGFVDQIHGAQYS